MATMEPGTVLKNRYKVTELLGQGGMGEVYLAMDETLDTKVAVKANHNLSEHTSAQFIREARLLASLKHPNLPRVIDYFTENDSQYLVMDFIPGDNLKEIVEGKHEISLPLVIKWATQLGNALAYLHTQNPPIYHRDIKPANIKLTPSGEVVLVDFGIAKTGEASTETQTGAWAFSPGFAPPEQVSGMRTGPYTDQFSLAATIYYLIAGKPPADSARRLMGEEEYVSLKRIKPALNENFSKAVDKALSIKPDDRFATVADFIDVLISKKIITDSDSENKTVVGSSRSMPPQAAPPQIIPSSQMPVGGGAPQTQKKSSTIWWVLGGFAILGVLTGGFFALKSLGIIGTIQAPAPTLTQTVEIASAITETSEGAATSTIEMPTPTETVSPTPEKAVFTSIGRGGKVAFVSDRQGDGYKQVWMMEVGMDADNKIITQNLEQLTFSPNDKTNPSWSPDGTKIIYSGLSTDFSANGNPFANDIWMIDLANRDQEPIDLSSRGGDDLYAAWSPNNKFIAFTSYIREDKTPQLVVMNPDGSNQKLLSILGFSDSYSTWSPNGDWLLYVYSTGELDVLQMISQFNIMKKEDRTTKDFQKFDRTSNEGRLGHVLEPAVSYDGSMIAYTQEFNGKTNIATAVFADRGRTSTVLTNTGVDFSPCWSADGKWILFTSTRDGDSEVYIMDSTGEQVTNLTLLPSNDSDPSWQPPSQQ